MNQKTIFAGAALAAILAVVCPSAPSQPFERRTPVVAAVEKIGPAVVNILTTRLETRNDMGWWFNPRVPRTYKATSLGSGVLVDSIGLVVTNEHVVRNAAEIKVHLSDGRILKARRIEQAVRSLDLALLQVENDGAEPFPHVNLGRSHDIMVGETVIAVGNPFGLENTVTTGVISAKNRTITPALGSRVSYHDLLQTDASINPGNSGGALVNVNGELIGINTAIHARGEGIGFAIPVDAVRSTIIQLLQLEMSSRGESLGVGVAARAGGGVAVTSVAESSPAATAGITAGDRVHAIGSRKVESPLEYNLALYASSGRSAIRVLLHRKGKRLEMKISGSRTRREHVLTYLADRTRLALEGPSGKRNLYIRQRIGIIGTDLDPPLKRLLGLPVDLAGTIVLQLENSGPAAELGLQRFDVVLGFVERNARFGKRRFVVQSVADLEAALRQLGRQKSAEIQIYRRKENVMHGPIGLR